MASPAQLRSLYRSLLRELPPRPVLARDRSPIHRSLRASFLAPSQAGRRQDQSPPPSPSSHSATPPSSSSSPAPSKETSASTSAATPLPITADIPMAQELAAYLRAQRTYVGMIKRYNPGMGMDEEERVRLTARRVGMNLPVEFDPTRRQGTA